MRRLILAIVAILVAACATYAPSQPPPKVDPAQLAATGSERQPDCNADVGGVRIKPGYWRIYPEQALNQGVQGWAFVRLDVEPDGATSHETVIYSEPGDTFDEAALMIVRTWLFSARAERCEGIVRRVSFRLSE